MTLDDINIDDLTPMMKHWASIKLKYPEHLLAYRMGDFFEFFYDDAEKISKLIGITLTKRKIGNSAYPLAGIPHHSVKNHFNNLIKQGQTVVIVEQLEDPTTVKGRIVKRGVTRILSPGTIIDFDMLKLDKNNYISSMVRGKHGYGVAFADLSTGEFVTKEFTSKEGDPLEKLLSTVSQYDPVEIVVPSDFKKDEKTFVVLTDLTDAVIKTLDDQIFDFNQASETIVNHFNLSNLAGFGLENSILAVQAAGGLLKFLKETQMEMLPNIFKILLLQDTSQLHLDYVTQRNLELVSSLWEKGKDTSLFSIFNDTYTPMGARLLKKIILQPLLNINEINQRLNIVEKFKNDVFLRTELREQLKIIGDLERYINRINYSNRSNARDLLNVKESLENIPKIKDLLIKANISEIAAYLEKINDFKTLRTLIEVSIHEEPPLTITEGGIIKDGFNEKVDDLRDVLNNGMQYVLTYEENLKNKWNINTGLKISHNNILGYYIQITHNTLKSIENLPLDFNERATLKNAKRYTTPELKKIEEKILTAREQISDVEYEIFCTIRDKVVEQTNDILETAKALAYIDVLSCFAENAERYGYCRPIMSDDLKIDIKEGRHPVVERLNVDEAFIPNDCYLDTESEQVLIITGPNMSGKSTILRQVALTCILAQMGSFVPAKSAYIGVIDQVFTRIGASDDLARKLSTFMIEMTETAKILNYATPKSLVIIDELGRGTSTSDGQSIALATLETLHQMKIKTLFSTHYHQLTEIKLPRVRNYHLDIIENEDGSINFVRKLRPGSTDKSYGIHVAKLAGIPDAVIKRAFGILEEIEKNDPFKTTVREKGGNSNEKKKIQKKDNKYKGTFNSAEERQKKLVQTSFFRPIVKTEASLNGKLKRLIEIVENMDIENLTPVDAMKKLIRLKEELLSNKN
ncbi:MAG: DNA mismatch repair protein MutS [Candidatus Lokiarchaeota archaeon]|nr:DNA mismatch repair protein MutS [Candidatus Lokiarchaeota archaeon]